MAGTLVSGGGGGWNLYPLSIFFFVLSVQLLGEFLEILKKRASRSSEQSELRQEIKQLLTEASSLSTPSTFAQSAKLRRLAAAKEKELLKKQEEQNKESKGSHELYEKLVFVSKVLVYLGLSWYFWSAPVAAVPQHLLQPFGTFLSWTSKDSTGLIKIGIIPWLVLTSQVSKIVCQKILKVALPK